MSKVYVILADCADPYFGPEFEGHIFSSKEKAVEYINSNKSIFGSYIQKEPTEIEIDSIETN